MPRLRDKNIYIIAVRASLLYDYFLIATIKTTTFPRAIIIRLSRRAKGILEKLKKHIYKKIRKQKN